MLAVFTYLQEVINLIVKKGEVYYADLNPIIGCEQGGCRPVIIVQNNTGNLYSPTTIIVPVTARKRKKALPTHIKVKGAGLPKKSIALLEQLRTIDKSRLKEKIGEITQTSLNKIGKGLLISLGCFENRRCKNDWICYRAVCRCIYRSCINVSLQCRFKC